MSDSAGGVNAAKLKNLYVHEQLHKSLRMALIKHDRQSLREVTDEAIADWLAKHGEDVPVIKGTTESKGH